MNKSLQNLERLCQKMQTRYGAMDPMVVQLKEELATKKLLGSGVAHWTSGYQRSSAARPQADARGR